MTLELSARKGLAAEDGALPLDVLARIVGGTGLDRRTDLAASDAAAMTMVDAGHGALAGVGVSDAHTASPGFQPIFSAASAVDAAMKNAEMAVQQAIHNSTADAATVSHEGVATHSVIEHVQVEAGNAGEAGSDAHTASPGLQPIFSTASAVDTAMKNAEMAVQQAMLNSTADAASVSHEGVATHSATEHLQVEAGNAGEAGSDATLDNAADGFHGWNQTHVWTTLHAMPGPVEGGHTGSYEKSWTSGQGTKTESVPFASATDHAQHEALTSALHQQAQADAKLAAAPQAAEESDSLLQATVASKSLADQAAADGKANLSEAEGFYLHTLHDKHVATTDHLIKQQGVAQATQDVTDASEKLAQAEAAHADNLAQLAKASEDLHGLQAAQNGAGAAGTESSGPAKVLGGVEPTQAQIGGADLFGANLQAVAPSQVGAGLDGADLSQAQMNGPDLSGVKLSGADLSGANFQAVAPSHVGTGLDGADLSQAQMNGTDLSGAKLSPAHVASSDGAGGAGLGTVIAQATEAHATLSAQTDLSAAKLQAAQATMDQAKADLADAEVGRDQAGRTLAGATTTHDAAAGWVADAKADVAATTAAAQDMADKVQSVAADHAQNQHALATAPTEKAAADAAVQAAQDASNPQHAAAAIHNAVHESQHYFKNFGKEQGFATTGKLAADAGIAAGQMLAEKNHTISTSTWTNDPTHGVSIAHGKDGSTTTTISGLNTGGSSEVWHSAAGSGAQITENATLEAGKTVTDANGTTLSAYAGLSGNATAMAGVSETGAVAQASVDVSAHAEASVGQEGSIGAVEGSAKETVEATAAAGARAGASLGFNGASVQASASAQACVDSATKLGASCGDVNGSETTTVYAKAFAQADAEASLNLNPFADGKVGAKVGCGAMAGTAVGVEETGHVGIGDVASAEASGGVYAGEIGATASVDAGIDDGKFHANVDLGAALGVGVHVSFNVNVDFGAAVHGAADAIGDVGQAVGSAATTVGNAISDAGSAVGHFFSDLF